MTKEEFLQLVAGHLPAIEYPTFHYEVVVCVSPKTEAEDLAKIKEWVELEPVDAPAHDWSMNPWIIAPNRHHYRFTCVSQAEAKHRIGLLSEQIEIDSMRRVMRKVFHPFVFRAVQHQSHLRANIDIQLILREIVSNLPMTPQSFDRDGLQIEIRAVERHAELQRFNWDAWASVPVSYNQNVMVISQAGQPLCAYWYAMDQNGLICQVCPRHGYEDEDRWVEYLVMDLEAADWGQLVSIMRSWTPSATVDPEPRSLSLSRAERHDILNTLRNLAVRVKLADVETLSYEGSSLTIQPMMVPCRLRDRAGNTESYDRFQLELHQNGEFVARYKFVWDTENCEVFMHPHIETELYRFEEGVCDQVVTQAIEHWTKTLTRKGA